MTYTDPANLKKMRVYEDPTYPNDKMLMGYKGKNSLDSGYVLSPYVPTPTVMEPSAVERLGGLADPELQADIDKRDEKLKDRVGPFTTFDMMPSPSVAGAYPKIDGEALLDE